jgi:ATP-dependent RNA helicase RhlE
MTFSPTPADPLSSSPAPAGSSERRGLALSLLPETLGICRLHHRARIPRWVFRSPFYALARTREELSIVCREDLIPHDLPGQRDWRAIKVAGPLDFALIGVVASLAVPLARARISIFTVSTFDTDYLLVRRNNLARAMEVLAAAGHVFVKETVAPPAEDAELEGVNGHDADALAIDEDAEEDIDTSKVEAVTAEVEPAGESMAAVETEIETESATESATASPMDPATDTEAIAAAELAAFEMVPEEKVAAASPAPPADPFDLRPAPFRTQPDPVIGPFTLGPLESEEPAAPPLVEGGPATRAARPADEVAEEDEQDFDTEGMFTGAIPQHDVELTDDTFESIGISAAIRKTIGDIGFLHPTPIQAAVIPLALEGGDIIGLAETGSGKTGAFGLPLAERLTHGNGLRGLILCPTREIALQTKAFLDIFGKNHELFTTLIIGGVKMGPQVDALRRGPDIVVATPGRLCDHLRRRTVRLDKLEELVLDEADHMLDLGFLPQIQEILEELPENHRTMMFSATMPPPIERLAQRFMRDPYMVDLRPVGHVAAGIEHRLYLVREDDKKPCLVELLKQNEGSTLIFTRRRLHAEWLARQLEASGLPVDRIHSDRTQAQRVRALRGFREGRFRILVATDVAARGIDVPRLQHVINFGMPETVDDYVHRAGRTARGAAIGVVSTIATWLEKAQVADVERVLGISIPRMEAPGVAAYQEIKRRPTVRKRRLL